MTISEAALAAMYPSANAEPAAASKPVETPKTDAARAVLLFNGPDTYKSPFGQIGRAAGDYPADPQKPPQADPKAPQAPQEPVTPEALGIDPANPLAGDAAKVLGELGIRDKAAVEKLTALQAKESARAWDAVAQGWQEASKAEFQPADLDAARSALAQHGDAELISLMQTYRLGDNPAVIRFMKSVAGGSR